MLKLAWLDPDLKNFKSVITVRDPKGETKLHLQQLEVVVTKMYANGDIEFIDLSDPEQKTQDQTQTRLPQLEGTRVERVLLSHILFY